MLAPADVRGERVLFLADEDNELAVRLRDELIADGFDVIVRDEHDVIDVIGSAVALDAAAVIELHGPRIDLWCNPSHEPVEHAVLDGSLVDKDTVAVRAAELVRARLLSPRAPPSRPAPIVAAPVMADGVPLALDGSVAARASVALAGVPPALAVDAVIAARFGDNLIAGVNASAPLFAAHVATSEAAADVSSASVRALIGARLSAAPDLDVTASLRVGPAWIHGAGQSSIGTSARDADVVVASVGVALALRYAIARPAWLFVAIDGDALTPTPTLVLGSSSVPYGPVLVGIAAGVAIALPDPS